ncbi:MAG TPA: GxxExxY protein [Aridibacter sp.]|nr:GxxExxY protein [Aridibacter sp.]
MSESSSADLIKAIMGEGEDPEGLNNLTEKIIGSAYAVANTLGVGFLEKVYENALSIEFRGKGFDVEQQYAVKVEYKGNVVDDFVADVIVEDKVIVELKAVNALDKIHAAQCLNYLRATGYTICLLINFGKPRIDVRRLVLYPLTPESEALN